MLLIKEPVLRLKEKSTQHCGFHTLKLPSTKSIL